MFKFLVLTLGIISCQAYAEKTERYGYSNSTMTFQPSKIVGKKMQMMILTLT